MNSRHLVPDLTTSGEGSTVEIDIDKQKSIRWSSYVVRSRMGGVKGTGRVIN